MGGTVIDDILLVWTDVETTGLDPNTDRLLEIGIVLTDGDLEPLEEFYGCVSPGDLKFIDVYPTVLEMHSDNGLWTDCVTGGISPHELRQRLAAWTHDTLVPMSVNYQEEPMLAGSSVHFDRTWIAKEFPEFLEKIGHRHFDLSSIKAGNIMWNPTFPEPSRSETAGMGEWPTHRALTDIRYDLRRARSIRDCLYKLSASARDTFDR